MRNALGVALGLLAGVALNLELGLLSVATSGDWSSDESSPLHALGALILLLLEAAGCAFLLLRREPDTATVARRGCVLGILLSVAMFPLLAFSKSAVERAGRQRTDLVEVFEAQRESEAFASMSSWLMGISSFVLVLCVAVLAVLWRSRRDRHPASRKRVDGAGGRSMDCTN